MTRNELIAAIRAHAVRYYACGWDILVECWTDVDLSEEIGEASTVEGALRRCADALMIPVRIDEPYLLTVAAEDGEHIRGFASFGEACAEWVRQSGRDWDRFASSAWEEHGCASTTDDYGRRITIHTKRSN